jgi:hypothetical protein
MYTGMAAMLQIAYLTTKYGYVLQHREIRFNSENTDQEKQLK